MAEALEVGTAYLQIAPSADGLQKKTDALVKKTKAPDIVAKIDADIAGLEKQAAKARQVVESLKSAAADPQIGLDLSVLEARKAVAEGKLKELDSKTASPQVTLQTAKLNAEISRISTQMDRLNAKRASPEVDAKIAQAEANVASIDRKITALQSKRATVQIGADGAAKTVAELDAVQGKANRLNGSRAAVNIAAAGGAQASGMLGLIVAGLAAVAAAAPAAVAALGAVAGTASALGQAGGAAAAGFSGIGDAIKSVEADEKSAATSSAGAAKSRSNSAGQIASAQSSLAQAVMQADRAAITGGQQVAQARQSAARTQIQGAESVADASRAVARAQQQADRAAITSGQQVAAARRAVSDAVVAAAERTQAAERSVARAQDSARYAQQSLTRARLDAAQANKDLQLSLAGIAISEKRAELALRKAIAARASGGDVDPEMFKGEELDLDVAEAAQNLAEVKDRFGDLRAEQARFAAGGVDGSDQVIAAQRAVRDANLSVEDSVRSLTQTQRDGARSVSDAVQAQSQAQQQAAWAQQDAAASVADAQLASGRAARDAAWANQDAAQQTAQAQQQAAWAQQDAAKGVADAQRGLQEALKGTEESAGGAGAAGKKSAYDLAQLTPAGRSFVAFWLNEWKPAMEDVSNAVASEMLPRIETGMRQLLGIQPELKAGLSGTGAVLGDLAIKGSNLATSPAFRASFVQIMDSNNRSLTSWGNAALSGADSARVLTVAGLPLSERLARAAEASSQGAESFLLQKESTGELGRAMEFGAQKAGQLLDVAGSLVTMILNVGEAIAPVGSVVLDTVSAVAQFVGEFAQGNQGLVQFIATAALAASGLGLLTKGVVALQSGYKIAAGGAQLLFGAVSSLGPATIYNSTALTKMRTAAVDAGPAIATYAQGLTGSAKAGDLAAKSTTWAANAGSKLAAGLPALAAGLVALYAIADAGSVSMGEATSAMEKGGAAARASAQEIAARNEVPIAGENWFNDFNTWLKDEMGIATSVEKTRAELEKKRSEMSNLEAAQSRLTEAQGNYELAVRDFGAASPQATAALADLRNKSRDVEIAQIAVREKTDLATAALLYQRDQILASLDADLRLRMSKQQLAKDQSALNDAIAQNGPKSQEAIDAGLQLEQTQLRTLEAAKSSAGGQRAYTDSLRDMVAQAKGQLTPTLAGAVQSLDGTGLAAIGAKVHIDETGRAIATLPNGQTVVLDVNNSAALMGLQGVTYQLGLVPPGKTITVNALTEPEKQKLMDLGFTVTTLPNGNVQVTANDAQARNTLIAFQQFAAWQQANPQLAADPARAYAAMQGFLRDAGAQTGVPALDADPARADATVRGKLDEFNRWHAAPTVDVNTKPADDQVKGWWETVLDWFRTKPVAPTGTGATPYGAAAPGVGQGRARGGLVEAASGGHIQHKQVIRGYPTGGKVRGPGGPTADKIPAMLSDGEYVVRAASVRAVGVPALDQINAMRAGGLVGYAAGGGVKPQPAGAAAAPAAAGAPAVAVPSADAGAAAGAAGATSMLAGAMTTAGAAAGALAPQLAAVTMQQQQMVSAGVTPLAGAMLGQLVPAVAAGNQQIGVAAPLAHSLLQGAQLQTQLSTNTTATNAAMNNASMAATTGLMSTQGQIQHAGLRAGQYATQMSQNATNANTAANNAGMVASTTGMSLAAQGQHAGLRLGQQATQASTNQTAAVTYAKNTEMAVSTGVMSQVNQGHLGALRGAQGVTTGSTVGFADAWRAQLARTQPDSANPLRYVINVPIRGVVDAWNSLDQQFALGKHVNPYVAGFATGGSVPGHGNSDTVPAMLTPGEYVISKPVVQKWGIDNINAAHMAARSGRFPGLEGMFTGDLGKSGFTEVGFNKGGPVAVTAGGPMGVQYRNVGGAIDNARRVAASMNGKKYVYGGGSAAGTDCSGMVAFVTRALNMDPNPYRRIGTTASFPWGGFAPGLKSAWSVGNNPGIHMAGTLAGTNIESGGSHGTSAFGGPAVGADNGQFPGKWHLPQVGGVFVSGGAGGGGFFDPTPIVNDAFKGVYADLDKMPAMFGPSDQVARDQGVGRFSADNVKGHAMAKLSEMFMSAGGGGVPDVALANLIIGVGKAMGFPRKGPEVALATALQESGLHNINYGDRDSIGPFQQRPSMGWGSPQQIMNPRYSAAKFYEALRGVRGWEGMPHAAAAQAVQRSAFPGAYAKWVGQAVDLVNRSGLYDRGGVIPPDGIAINRSGKDELGLDPVETRSYDTLTRLVGQNGMQLDLGAFEPPQRGDVHILENGVIRETADADQVMQRVEFLVGTGSL